MSTLATAGSDSVSRQAWARLAIACALSVALHVALVLGIPVNPTGGVPFVTSMINARLEPATNETSVETLVEPQLPNVAPEVAPDKPVIMDPLADPVAKKPEPKPEQATIAPAASPSAGIEMPLIRDPTYYPAAQLDVYPRPMAEIERKCPPAAEANRINGGVLILLLINEFGSIDDVSIVESQPEGYFEEYALSLFRAMRFYPAEKQGRAVKSRAPIRVRFMCGDIENAAR